MKVPAGKIDGFIKNLDPSILGVLIYGPDIGLVSQRAETIGKLIVEDLNDPFQTVNIDSDQLKEDPAILSDEISAMSFSGGRRLIKMREPATGLSNIFKDALTNAPETAAEGSFLIVTAGNLTPASGIRKLFETADNLAALPCYQDDQRSLYSVVKEELAKHNLSYDNDVVMFLSHNCLGDRLVVVGEIEKLSIYMGDETRVTLEDVQKCVGQTTESSFEDICDAVAEGDQSSLEVHLTKALQQGAMPISILRAVSRHFMRIHSVVGQVFKGAPLDQALSSLRPPVFFKEMPKFKSNIGKWRNGKKSLWKAMDLIYQAELECKKTGVNQDLMCNRFLMKIAALSKLRST